jgi:hypothetical protein
MISTLNITNTQIQNVNFKFIGERKHVKERERRAEEPKEACLA